MNFKTHNEIVGIHISDTSLQGQINADYYDLVDLFGMPMDGDGYKVDAEWWVQFANGTVATIYNWKNGRNYLGNDGLDVRAIEQWNIGGKSGRAVELVQKALELANA